MGNINDIPQIEGIRDVLTDQLYEYVFPYMRKHGYFDENQLDNEMVKRVRDFLERTNNLTNLELNEDELQKEINSLKKELLELLEISNKDNIESKDER